MHGKADGRPCVCASVNGICMCVCVCVTRGERACAVSVCAGYEEGCLSDQLVLVVAANQGVFFEGRHGYEEQKTRENGGGDNEIHGIARTQKATAAWKQSPDSWTAHLVHQHQHALPVVNCNEATKKAPFFILYFCNVATHANNTLRLECY